MKKIQESIPRTVSCQDLDADQLYDLDKYLTKWFGEGCYKINGDIAIVSHGSMVQYKKRQREGWIHETFSFYLPDDVCVVVKHEIKNGTQP
jgi:hypothetical protein